MGKTRKEKRYYLTEGLSETSEICVPEISVPEVCFPEICGICVDDVLEDYSEVHQVPEISKLVKRSCEEEEAEEGCSNRVVKRRSSACCSSCYKELREIRERLAVLEEKLQCKDHDDLCLKSRQALFRAVSPSVAIVDFVKKAALATPRDHALSLAGTGAYGSGFIIHPREKPLEFGSLKSTYILTCAHLISKYFTRGESIDTMNYQSDITAVFYEMDNFHKCEICYVDFTHDILILKFEDEKLRPPMAFSESTELRGTTVYTISHPKVKTQMEMYTFTKGMISHAALASPSPRLTEDIPLLIYTLKSGPGSSGAPVFDKKGHVVAMHSMRIEEFGYGIGLQSIRHALSKVFNMPEIQQKSEALKRSH